jgi:hypothetical protein
MKLTEIIEELQFFKDIHGELEVEILHQTSETEFEPVTPLNFSYEKYDGIKTLFIKDFP